MLCKYIALAVLLSPRGLHVTGCCVGSSVKGAAWWPLSCALSHHLLFLQGGISPDIYVIPGGSNIHYFTLTQLPQPQVI